MKVKLKFDFDKEEDVNRYKHCMKAVDYSIALWQLGNIYQDFKHYSRPLTLDEVVNHINKVFEDNNININELD